MARKGSKSSSKIVGSVYDSKGKPIAGARLNCDGRYTRTLFDGSYRFENLSPSTYVVTVTQEGFESQKKAIKLDESKTASLDFRLILKEGFGKIYGYVFDSSTGKPIVSGGTMIMVLPSKNKQVPIYPKDGYFEFQNLPLGTHQVWASVLGYGDEFKRINLKEKEEKRVDFFCRRKESIEPPWG